MSIKTMMMSAVAIVSLSTPPVLGSRGNAAARVTAASNPAEGAGAHVPCSALTKANSFADAMTQGRGQLGGVPSAPANAQGTSI